MSESLAYASEDDPLYRLLQRKPVDGDPNILYLREKTAKKAVSLKVPLPEAFFLAASKARKRSKFPKEQYGQSAAYAVAAAFAHSTRALPQASTLQGYFDPEPVVTLVMEQENGCDRFELEGLPQKQQQCERSFALKLYNKQMKHSSVPNEGDLRLKVAYRVPGEEERACAFIEANYNLTYLASKDVDICHGCSNSLRMCLNMYEKPCESELERAAAPLSKALLEFLVRRDAQGYICGYSLRSIEIFNDYPYMRHYVQPRSCCKPRCKRRKHACCFSGSKLIGQEQEAMMQAQQSPAAETAEEEEVEVEAEAETEEEEAAPTAEEMEKLKGRVDGALQGYLSRVDSKEDDAFEYVLRDPQGLTSITNVQTPSGQQKLWSAGNLARTIIAAGVLRHLYAERDPNEVSPEPQALDDPNYLVQKLDKSSLLAEALVKAYEDRGMALPTLRQLLLDTSGLPSFLPVDAATEVSDIMRDDVTPPDETSIARLMAANMSPIFRPGSKVVPSDVNSMLLLALLARMEGLSTSDTESKPTALQELVEREARSSFGMQSAMYDPVNRGKRYEERVARSYQPYLPGPYGLQAGNVGLYVTASDLGAMMATLLDPAAPPHIMALTQPRVLMSRQMMVAMGFGGTQIDDWSVPGARVVKLASSVPCGHTLQLLMYPERQVGVAFAANTPCHRPSYGYHARTPKRLFTAIKSVPAFSEKRRMRLPAEAATVGLPPGYGALFAEQAELGSSVDSKDAMIKGKQDLLDQLGNVVLQTIIATPEGMAESVELRDTSDPYTVQIVHNQDEGTAQYAIYNPRTSSYMLVDSDGTPGDFIVVEDVKVPDAPEGALLKALRLNGQVFYSPDAAEALLAEMKRQDDESTKDVDETLVTIDAEYAKEASKIGQLWPFLAGAAVGGLATLAIRPWRRRRVYYVPAYGYPYLVHRRPHYYHYPTYIWGNFNEMDERAKMEATDGPGIYPEEKQAMQHEQAVIGQRQRHWGRRRVRPVHGGYRGSWGVGGLGFRRGFRPRIVVRPRFPYIPSTYPFVPPVYPIVSTPYPPPVYTYA